MNVKKKKTMVISKFSEEAKIHMKINLETFMQVTTFKYLVQTITPGGKNEQEISIKIAAAKNRFQQLLKHYHQRRYL